jgi:predicted nucleic acid-binding protein
MPLPFLDTNILLRHILHDDPRLGSMATALIRRIENGELQARTSDTVVFETVYTLQRSYKLPRPEIADVIQSILELPAIVLPFKQNYRRVFELFLSTNVGFADCYHAVQMQQLGLTEVLSFDRDFDKLPGIVRREE